MILFFIYTHDCIQKAVKLETSLLSERRASYVDGGEMKGEMYNDLLVFDEEYEILFKRLFSAAHGELLTHISSNYLAQTPTDLSPVFREFPDFRQDRDFALWLHLHADFPTQYRKSIDIKIEQFLIDYICYRWFETKLPAEAGTYFSRMESTLHDIRTLLVRKSRPMRRYPSFP